MILYIYQRSISYLPIYLNNNGNILWVELKMSNIVAIINSLTIVKINDESITDGGNSAGINSRSLSVKKKKPLHSRHTRNTIHRI